jgi:precorrin isomerase
MDPLKEPCLSLSEIIILESSEGGTQVAMALIDAIQKIKKPNKSFWI